MSPTLMSIELTNRCPKACWFCYNHSTPAGETAWTHAGIVAALDGLHLAYCGDVPAATALPVLTRVSGPGRPVAPPRRVTPPRPW